MKYLVLNLKGHLMSFGEGDYWDVRGTNSFPTKSFVVGLIAAGLGYSRKDTEKIRNISESIGVACREDKHPTILRDYHTILDTKKADGKKNENAVVSPRYYLADASFTVLVGIKNESIKDQIINSFIDPVWPCYLGRKSCVPSSPIFNHTEIDEENDYLAFLKLRPKETTNDQEKIYSCVGENYSNGRLSYVKDDVISFEPRVYKERKVYYYTLSSTQFEKKDVCE